MNIWDITAKSLYEVILKNLPPAPWMEAPNPTARKRHARRGGLKMIIVSLLLLAAFVLGMGYNLDRLNEQMRSVKSKQKRLEEELREDRIEIKRRLENMDREVRSLAPDEHRKAFPHPFVR